MLPHLRSFENPGVHLCIESFVHVFGLPSWSASFFPLGCEFLVHVRFLVQKEWAVTCTSFCKRHPEEKWVKYVLVFPCTACYVKLYVPCNIADLKWQMSDSAWHHPTEDWKHSGIQMFGVMWINPQMIDWIFQFSLEWLALCVHGLVLSTLRPPHHSGFKKWHSWTQVFRELLMGHSILPHVLLKGKLTTSGPKAISVYQSSLTLSTSIY